MLYCRIQAHFNVILVLTKFKRYPCFLLACFLTIPCPVWFEPNQGRLKPCILLFYDQEKPQTA